MSVGLRGRLGAGLLAAWAASGCAPAEPPPPRTFEAAAPERPRDTEAAEAEAVLAVDGMVCQGCANAAAAAASEVPGCVAARGVFEDGTVVVRYRPDVTTPDAIAAAITAADRGDAPAFTARPAAP